MKFLNKCIVVAMSALFAATPVVPAGAMPLPVPKVQPVAATGGDTTQLVRYDDRARPYVYRRNSWRGERGWRGDRGWRAERRWHGRDRNVGWRDRGDRYGWYRGHRGYRYNRPGYRYHDGYWFPFAAFGAGALIGGAIANDRGYVGGGGSHVNWCENRYRSYRAYDNTFQPYNGPRRQCISPYS
jgi:hypothetical protein